MIRAAFVAFCVAGLLLAAPTRAQVAGTASADDTARLLAGMQPSSNSPLARLADDPSSKQHASLFDAAFDKLETERLGKMREWSAANLTAPRAMMYYLFSGPDFLHANAFFPHASTYVLSGLEPVGQVPELTKLPRGAVGQTLRNIQVSLSSILSMSYFITKNMREDLNNGLVSGTLPILYVFLARSGKEIRDVSLVNLDEHGNLQSGDGLHTKSTARGVKIVFAAGDGQIKTLFYFSTNVGDEYNGQYALLKFCRQFSLGDSFLKSASYLLHRTSFSQTRKFLLDQSALILQDDSGIPLGSFETGKWFLHPFGRYTTTLSMFQEHYQPKLTELFQRRQPRPIDFGIGYMSRFGDSNLMLAIKNFGAPDLAAPVLKDAAPISSFARSEILRKPSFPTPSSSSKNKDEQDI